MSGRVPSLYSDPDLYDLVHAAGTDDEVWMLDKIARDHGVPERSALEPACGTGRYLVALARRGWRVAGYDSTPVMTAYARKRLAKYGSRARIMKGDMATFRGERRYGLIFNLLSTFRHILTEREALAHLRNSAKALLPGGLFVLGLDLAAYGEDHPDEEVFECRRGSVRAKHVVMSLPADKDKRRERIINFVTAGKKRLESAYDLRSYDTGQLKALLKKSPFKVVGCYGYDGKPAVFGGSQRALWLVLSAR